MNPFPSSSGATTGRLAGGCAPRLRDRNAAIPVNRELQPVIQQYHLPFEHFDALLKGVEMDLDVKRYEDYEDSTILLPRRIGRRPAEHRSLRLPGSGLPGLRGLPGQGAATDQHPARCPRPMPSAAASTCRCPNWRGSRWRPEEILRLEYSPRFFELAQQRGRARPPFLSAGPRDPARRGSPLDGRRRVDGLGLLAAAAQTGAQRFNVFGPERTRLSRGQKTLLILRTWCRLVSGAAAPSYGA